MIMRKGVVVLGLAAATAALAEQALAIPAFGRRYEVACNFCHETGFPRLNAAGQRFKDRGFRMASEDAFDFGAWARSLPVSVRGRLTQRFADLDDPTTASVKVMAAGNLGRRASFWIDTGVRGESGHGDWFTHTRPDNAWARVDVVPNARLYVKGGRFELDLPFSQARSPVLSPYEVYSANTGFESDDFGGFQDGIEVGGDLPRDVHWSAAVVAGRDPEGARDVDEDTARFDGNVFLRVAKRVSLHRFGAFAYVGRNVLAPARGQRAEDHLLRLGVDGSAWFSRVHVYGVATYGRNDNSVVTADAPEGTNRAQSFGGAFLQGDWHVRENLVLMLRGDMVSGSPLRTADTRRTYLGLHSGLQFFIRERVRLVGEYGFRNQDRTNVGTAQVDVAF